MYRGSAHLSFIFRVIKIGETETDGKFAKGIMKHKLRAMKDVA